MAHGHGEQGEAPTDPYASEPYPHPAVSHEPRLQHLAEDFARSGLKPFHTPLGIQIDEKNPNRSQCIRCGTCDGFPCLVRAKADAQVLAVDPALEFPNVTLLTNAFVERLETIPSGRAVSKVIVRRNGGREEYSAGVVVVSAGAINSAALLLRSANDRHPNGLANRSGVVGRHYMGHVNSVLMAVSKCPNPTIFQKSLSVNDFYFGDREFPYPMGHISFVGKLDGDTLGGGAPAIAPGFTLDLMARHSLDFWLTSEDLPDPDNRVTLDREGNIVLAYRPNNEEGHRRLTAELKRLMKAQTKCTVHGHECHEGLFARNLYLGQRIPLAGVAHQNGTVRFGRDPKTSGPHAPGRQGRRTRGVHWPCDGVRHQPLGRRRGGPARLPRDRALEARRDHAGLDVCRRRRPGREARVDGARRQHDVRPLSRGSGARAGIARAQGARQLP